MAKRKKKYNKMGSLISASNMALKNIAVWRSVKTHEQGTCEAIDTKHLKQAVVNLTLARMLNDLRHVWVVQLIAVCNDGCRDYFKSESVTVDRPILQSQLSTFLDEQHKRFIKNEVNQNHLTNVAWIASPVGFDFSESEIDEILGKFGAYD